MEIDVLRTVIPVTSDNCGDGEREKTGSDYLIFLYLIKYGHFLKFPSSCPTPPTIMGFPCPPIIFHNHQHLPLKSK